jgi:glycosyltransferase involved in cell wall biosynthesis
MALPKVTVLVTCRNSTRTIEKCVQSLIDLDYPNFDVFFVDAFSNDGTYEILQKYAKQKKIILKQKSGNPPKAYNFAIKTIRSEFTAFTNADCVADRKWLKELMKPLEDANVNASAGVALNPKKPENALQYVIGKELESRYEKFPDKLSRAPEMNFCVRTSIIRKIRFNEKFDVSYDTDLGYRMTPKYGKIAFAPKAVIYHYHRASWEKYFKQQFTYAKFVPMVYSRHKGKVTGDHISTPSMLLNIINLYLIVLSLLLSPLSLMFFYSFIVLFLVFFTSFIFQFNDFMENKYFFHFLSLFVIRTAAWCLGLPIGFSRLI